MKKSLTDLLENCTVRIEVGQYLGTGFFVAPGLILTCAHVIKPQPGRNPPIRVFYKKKHYKSEKISREHIFIGDYPDLALLRVDIPKHPCVYLDGDFQVRDEFYSYGYTLNQPKGEGITVDCEGTYDEEYRLIKLKIGEIQEGASGSPLLSSRTERVCGMIQLSRDTGSDKGGFAFPMESIHSYFPDLLDVNKKFHGIDKRWEVAGSGLISQASSIVATEFKKPGTIVAPGKKLFGREELMKKIISSLYEQQRVLLSGITGIGKTFIAENVAECLLQETQRRVIWLKVGNEETDSLMDALAGISENRQSYDNARGDNKRLALYSLLEETKASLLVFDDVRNVTALISILRAVPKTIPVLITSRQNFDVDKTIYVDRDQLELSQALALLGYYAGGEDFSSNLDAEKLCVKFDYHPLALELCGSIMRRQGRTPLEQLEKIISDPLNLSKPGHVGLQTLLEDSIADLDQQSRKVFIAFGIFFENGMSAIFLETYLGKSVEEFDRCLENLTDYNLIKRRPGTEYYYMHDLIFTYAQSLAKGADNKFVKIINVTIEYLVKNAKDIKLIALDLPNLLSVAKVADGLDLVKIISYLTIGNFPLQEGRSYVDQRGYSTGLIGQLDRAIEAARSLGEEFKPTTHYLLGKRGNAAFRRGDYQIAAKKYEEELLLSFDDKRRVLVGSILSRTLAFCGHKEESKKGFEAASQIAGKLMDDKLSLIVLGEESWVAGHVLEDHATALQVGKKQLVLAEALYARDYENYDHLGHALMVVGSAKLNLAKQSPGDVSDVLIAFERLKYLAEKYDDSALTADALQCFGEYYDFIGDKVQAQSNFDRSLDILRNLEMVREEQELIVLMKVRGYSVEYQMEAQNEHKD